MSNSVILLTIDELRRDGLSCYGNKNAKTPYADSLAADGVIFDGAIAGADFTPICHAGLLTGTYPNKHNIRHPFSYLRGTTAAEVFKGLGYKTAGFVGVSFLGSKHGFERGFDLYDEPYEGIRGSHSGSYPEGAYTLGNWWVERFFDWLDNNHESPFFVWGHYFFVHQGTEDFLLEQGLLEKGVRDEFYYLNPKIELMDNLLLKPLIERLKSWGIYHQTNIVLMADHGSNLGEHPVAPAPGKGFYHPQHVQLYDEDISIPLIIKAEGLPKGKRIPGMVRQIDVMPTIFDLMGIDTKIDFDGVSLLPFVEKGKAEGLTAYFEDLFDDRGPGALQGMRTDKYKFWRNLTRWTEELYDLEQDPRELHNLAGEKLISDPDLVISMRKFLNKFLTQQLVPISGKENVNEYQMTDKDKEVIEARLRSLGYIG